LFIDYGHSASATGATLRAVSHHRTVSALAAPGTADLSADVDFDAFAEAARAGGARAYGPVTQAGVLMALGAELRLAQRRPQDASEQRQARESSGRRLVPREEMGGRFKVMALASPGLATPAGFAANVGG